VICDRVTRLVKTSFKGCAERLNLLKSVKVGVAYVKWFKEESG
jgi:hypothetical protein